MLNPIKTFQARFGSVRYLMAPMAGITDVVFRTLIREMGAQVVISELTSSEGLTRGGKRTLDLIRFGEHERPVGIQLFGSSTATLVEAAKIIEQKGADFVDLNFGCPVKKVVCDGGGAAWLRDPSALGNLLLSIKKAIRIPLTIKVRTGWDEQSKNVGNIVRIASECGVDWVAIHGRTRAQGYSGLADWELIREVSQWNIVPIVGNGDIVTAEEAKAKIEGGFAHAVMIGRGALKNPWIFREMLGISSESKDFIKLIERHFEIALEYKDGLRAFLSLKKFLGWYAAGLPKASEFRKQIFETNDIDDLRDHSLSYFSSCDFRERSVDRQPFLMGGHG